MVYIHINLAGHLMSFLTKTLTAMFIYTIAIFIYTYYYMM